MTLYLDKRTRVWYLRERITLEGVNTKRRKATRIGTLSDLPTKADAERAAQALSTKCTTEPPISTVVERYLREGSWDRLTTYGSYSSVLHNHVVPRWGSSKLSDIRPLELNEWFKSLDMAPMTKSRLKTVFSQVWHFAALNELVTAQQNPLELIRIKRSSRRQIRPQILTAANCQRLVENIYCEPFKTMVIVALCLGLRRSELTGLKWGDFDWIRGTVMVQRSVVENKPDVVKTEASEKALPLDPALTSLLQQWRGITAYKADSDWVWASPKQSGALPFYPGYVQKRYLGPAGRLSGLGEHVGWHTLRHAYRTLLASAGASLTVQKDLLRHSNIATTANVYGGALPEDQRTANSAVVGMVIQ